MYNHTLSQSFRRQNRLTTPHDYQTVFRAGRRLSGKHLTVLFCPNQLEYSRLGLVVSKKQIRTAVARNTVKRAIRESFRMKQHDFKGLDIVMIAYKSLTHLDKSELRTCIDKQCARLPTQRASV